MKSADGMRYLVVAGLTVSLGALLTIGSGCSKNESTPAAAPEVDLSKAADLFSNPVQDATDPGKVLAEVDGKKITQGEVDEEVENMMKRARRKLPPERLAQMKGQFAMQAVDNLIMKSLLLNAIEKDGVQVSDEEVSVEFEKIKTQLPEGMTLEQFLQNNNMTEAEIRETIKLEMTVNKLITQHTDDKITPPTDEEVTNFFEENKERFATPETVTAKHILIACKPTEDEAVKKEKLDKAEKIRAELLAGGDFAELAKENSDCPSKERGGNLGSFSKNQMVPPFEEAAFSQKVGEVGAVVTTDFGYHIIVVEDHKDAKTVTLDEVKDRIQQIMTNQQRQKAAQQYVTELKAAANISYPGMPAPVIGTPTMPEPQKTRSQKSVAPPATTATPGPIETAPTETENTTPDAQENVPPADAEPAPAP